jgi:hypothetical protein
MPDTTNSILELIQWYVICILLGNGFGLLILFIAMIGGYKHAKSVIHFYNSIPEDVKTAHKMYILPVLQKYDYPNYQILNHTPSTPRVRFEKRGDKILLFIHITFAENVNFYAKMEELNKKYEHQNISLTNEGLKKTMDSDDWDNLIEYILELLEITSNENMNVMMWNKKFKTRD